MITRGYQHTFIDEQSLKVELLITVVMLDDPDVCLAVRNDLLDVMPSGRTYSPVDMWMASKEDPDDSQQGVGDEVRRGSHDDRAPLLCLGGCVCQGVDSLDQRRCQIGQRFPRQGQLDRTFHAVE